MEQLDPRCLYEVEKERGLRAAGGPLAESGVQKRIGRNRQHVFNSVSFCEEIIETDFGSIFGFGQIDVIHIRASSLEKPHQSLKGRLHSPLAHDVTVKGDVDLAIVEGN
jgi:hypothetical protein